ncbi:MAG: hypothetical protein K8L97_21440 [Anaerolineae bacterium]|nr:hypothetical protein [Anaerolineae bacterium]
MDRSQIIIIISLAIGIVFCVPTVRRSIKKDKIYGGVLAEAFHYIAVAAYLSVLPAALLGSFLVGPFKLGIPLAFTFLGIALVALFFYALIEHPARANLVVEDRGWTEQDARSSGL